MQTRSRARKEQEQTSTSSDNLPPHPPLLARNLDPPFTLEVILDIPIMEDMEDLRPNQGNPPNQPIPNQGNPPRQDNFQNQGRRPPREEEERPIGDYITPTVGHYESPIYLPEGEDNEFEVKSGLIHMLRDDQYDGYGNPNSHLARFVESCRIYKTPGVDLEYLFMKVFSTSLCGRAKTWLDSHDPQTFHTWEELAQAFITQYFPPSMAKKIQEKIRNFTQHDDESFHDALERYKALQRECPQHGFSKAELLTNFYDGMDGDARNRMDQASGGGLMDLTATEGTKIIERLSKNSHQWGSERNHLRKKDKESSSRGITKEDFNSLSKTVNSLAKSIGDMNTGRRREHQQAYEVETRPSNNDDYEDVNFINRNQERGNIAHQSYSYQQPREPFRQVRFYDDGPAPRRPPQNNEATRNPPPGFPPKTQPSYQGNYRGEESQRGPPRNQGQNSNSRTEDKPSQGAKPSLASIVAQLAATQAQQQKDTQVILQQLEQMRAHNKMLETQIAQQASSSSRNHGKLPSQPDFNDPGSINAITLKSGKVLEDPQPNVKIFKPTVEVEEMGEPSKEKESIEDQGDDTIKEKCHEPPPYVPKVPFPQRLKKKKEEAHFKKFTDILSKLEVTLPFTEVLTQMPNYVKFLKDIISHRRVMHDVDHVDLNANCSAIIQHTMPKKQGDNGSFTIPITIGDVSIASALCDLGAGISLMPFSLFEKLDMGSLLPTSLHLRLADRSSRVPRGILEDVPIKIGKCYVPVDFYVLEMEEESATPIILGRPFLNTVKALINCGDGSIELDLGSEKSKFYLKKIMNAPRGSMDCSLLDSCIT